MTEVLTMNKEKEIGQLAVRVSSFDTSASTLYDAADIKTFKHGKTLLINARGIALVRLPLYSRQLEIQITDINGNLLYMSTRAKASSGNAILSSASENLVSTKYFWGPGRDPVMHLMVRGKDKLGESHDTDAEEQLLGPEIKTKSQWTSRNHRFVMPDGKQFEWTYVREKDENNKKATSLVLREMESSGKGRRIAKLVRNDETRTEGTKSCTAGNGGHLVLDTEAETALQESVIVATCLLMLKKEIDRRRALQFAVIAAAVQ